MMGSKQLLSTSSGFDSQFPDLAEMSAGPPSAKKPRNKAPTPRAVNRTPAARGGRAQPLQFTFKKSNENTVTEKSRTWVSKPRLEVKPASAVEDDWGDDGEDDDLLIAASQFDQPIISPLQQQVATDANQMVQANHEDLLAMTALMADDDFPDDFGEDGFADPGQDRLNQTATVFPGQEEKMKPPMQPDSHFERHKSEEETLRKLNLKYQGEASFLRGQLNRKEQEVEGERQARRKVETELQEKLEADKKAWEEQVSVVKTEKMFLLQELQQLKDRYRRESKQSQALMKASQVPKSSQKSSGSRLSFPSDSPRPQSSKETQTSMSKPRVGRLRLPISKSRLTSITICNLGPLAAESKAGLLMTSNFSQLESQVRSVVENTIEVGAGRQARESEVGELLRVLESILLSSPIQVTSDLRTSITEFCSNLLSSMIKVKQTEVLPAVLSLLVEAWRTSLQDSDVTSFVLSLIVRLITMSSTRLPESTVVLEKYFALIDLVGQDEDQRGVLCRVGPDQEDCFLLCLPLLISREEMAGAQLQAAAVEALSKWLLSSASLSPAPSFLTTCQWCASGVVAALNHLTKAHVRALLANLGEGRGELVALVEQCLMALSRYQEVVRGGPDGDDTKWVELIDSGAGLQRNYFWTLEQVQNFAEEFDEEVVERMHNLVLEVQTDSESMDQERPL